MVYKPFKEFFETWPKEKKTSLSVLQVEADLKGKGHQCSSPKCIPKFTQFYRSFVAFFQNINHKTKICTHFKSPYNLKKHHLFFFKNYKENKPWYLWFSKNYKLVEAQGGVLWMLSPLLQAIYWHQSFQVIIYTKDDYQVGSKRPEVCCMQTKCNHLPQFL